MKTFLQKIFDELVRSDKVASQVDFGNQLGYKSEGYISTLLKSQDDLPPKLQKKLYDVFGISKLWLTSNGKEGAMFGITPPEIPKRKVPLIGEGAAGNELEINVHDNPAEMEYIDVGDMLRDSEAAFTVYGNSMNPNYPSGCILGIRHNYDSFIQPGEIYLLVTRSNRVFKRLYYNEDRTGYVCHSDNTMEHEKGKLKGHAYYPPFEVNGKDVISVYDVVGMIKRTRNSGVIMRQN